MKWWNVIKRIGGGPPKKRKLNPSKRKGGKTIQGGSVQDKMNRLSLEYSEGNMTVEEYIKRRDKILGKDKR